MTLRIRYLTQTTLFAPPSAPTHQLKGIVLLHPTEICLHFKFLTGTARCSVPLVITHVHVSAVISVGGWKCVKVHRRRSAKQLVTRLSSLSFFAADLVWGLGWTEQGSAGRSGDGARPLSKKERQKESVRRHRARIKQNPYLDQLYKQRQRLYHQRHQARKKGYQQ